MWAEISEFIQQGPIRSEIIQSVLLIIGVLLVRTVILQTHFRRHPAMQIEDMRRWVVVSRNLTLIACLIGLISVWAAQIQTLALSMFAIAAAIVLATKELIMCLSGSLLRSLTKQYSVGDYIEIGGLRGRVVDINLVYTTLHETGAEGAGTILLVPNNLFFQRTVRRWRGPPPALPRLPGLQADGADARAATARGGALDLDD